MQTEGFFDHGVKVGEGLGFCPGNKSVVIVVEISLFGFGVEFREEFSHTWRVFEEVVEY